MDVRVNECMAGELSELLVELFSFSLVLLVLVDTHNEG